MGHFEDLRKKADERNEGLYAKMREDIARQKAEETEAQRQRDEEYARTQPERDAQLWRDLGLDPNYQPTDEEIARAERSRQKEREYVERTWKARLDEEDFRARQESMTPQESIDELNRRHDERESGERDAGPAEYFHYVDEPPQPRRRGFKRGR